MNRLFFPLFAAFAILAAPFRAQTVEALFAKVPREVLPMLDRTARLDLLDLYNGGLPAKAENVYGGQSELLLKTDSLLRLRTTDTGRWEMRLLPAQHDTLVATVYTVDAAGRSSRIEVYSRSWIPTAVEIPRPSLAHFFRPGGELSPARVQTLQAALRSMPVWAEWDDAAATLIFHLSTDGLSVDDKEAAAPFLHSLPCRWAAGKFVLQP